jgi:hypothetical protein
MGRPRRCLADGADTTSGGSAHATASVTESLKLSCRAVRGCRASILPVRATHERNARISGPGRLAVDSFRIRNQVDELSSTCPARHQQTHRKIVIAASRCASGVFSERIGGRNGAGGADRNLAESSRFFHRGAFFDACVNAARCAIGLAPAPPALAQKASGRGAHCRRAVMKRSSFGAGTLGSAAVGLACAVSQRRFCAASASALAPPGEAGSDASDGALACLRRRRLSRSAAARRARFSASRCSAVTFPPRSPAIALSLQRTAPPFLRRKSAYGRVPPPRKACRCCRSTVVVHSLGKGEVDGSIPSGSTISPPGIFARAPLPSHVQARRPPRAVPFSDKQELRRLDAATGERHLK